MSERGVSAVEQFKAKVRAELGEQAGLGDIEAAMLRHQAELMQTLLGELKDEEPVRGAFPPSGS